MPGITYDARHNYHKYNIMKAQIVLAIIGIIAVTVIFTALSVFTKHPYPVQPLAFTHKINSGFGLISKPFRKKTHVIQPMTFSHKKHAEEVESTCIDCHKQVEKQHSATTPLVKDCMECHFEAEGKDPNEPRIRDEYNEHDKEIPWIQVNRLPGHIYFSHAAHVKLGKMECKECHGEVEKMKDPISTPSISKLTMTKCMACHEEKKANNECLTCHK